MIKGIFTFSKAAIVVLLLVTRVVFEKKKHPLVQSYLVQQALVKIDNKAFFVKVVVRNHKG